MASIAFSITVTAGVGLLGSSDFTYLGKYIAPSAASSLAFGRTLTHRYVNGQLRFLAMGYGGTVGNDPVYEFTLPAEFGQNCVQTNEWKEIFAPALSGPNIGGGDEHGLWWDDAKGGLWCSQATDYPGAGTLGSDTGIYRTSCVTFRQLNADGTITGFQGKYGFAGIGQRAIAGGVRAVPASWQSRWNLPPYLYGFGGYTSLMAQGYGCSLGLMLVGAADVTGYPSPTSAIPTFTVFADHRTGATQSNYNPATGDRGIRLTQPTNYFDGGDPRPNPSTPPTVPPVVGARWLSPAPDGKNRWVWDDSYNGAVVCIDGPNKYGLVCIANLLAGNCYYGGSTLHGTARAVELHVYDPATLAQAAAGQIKPWAVQPSAMADWAAYLGETGGTSGNAVQGGMVAATFDATADTLYVWEPGVSGGYPCWIHAFKVNC